MKVKQYKITTKVKVYQLISKFFMDISKFFFFKGLEAFEKSATEVEMTEDEYDTAQAEQVGLSLEDYRALRNKLAADVEGSTGVPSNKVN